MEEDRHDDDVTEDIVCVKGAASAEEALTKAIAEDAERPLSVPEIAAKMGGSTPEQLWLKFQEEHDFIPVCSGCYSRDLQFQFVNRGEDSDRPWYIHATCGQCGRERATTMMVLDAEEEAAN